MAAMELKIYNPQDNGFLQKIEWNFEELKEQITSASRDYETLVYSDDAIRDAKADRAKLNKFVDAMNSKRTEIRKQLLKPDEQFGQEVKELTGIIQRAIKNIDAQVKGYEQRQRDEKTAKIREYYEENIHDLAEYLPFERVFRPEYANASTTMKSVRENISDMIQKVAEGLAILNEVDSKFAGDMKRVFLQTYDIGAAMNERNRLEAEEQRRAEYEAKRAQERAEREAARKAEADRVMQAGKVQPAPEVSATEECQAQAAQQDAHEQAAETVEDPVYVLDFRVHATRSQLNLLKEFLKTNGIRFEPVPKQ